MKRTTIFADDELLMELKELSLEEKKSVAELVRKAIAEFLTRKKPHTKKISFMGAGRSGRMNIAEKHEELLWKRHLKNK